MIPMTIHRRNAWQWLKFGLLELWRIIVAFCTGSGGREKAVAKYVEKHAQAGDAQSVIDAIDVFARDKRFLMNVGEEKGQILMDALGAAPSQRVLELGAYCGYSAVLIGQELAQTGGTLISVEASARNAEVAQRVVDHAGLSSVVEFQVGTGSERIPELTQPFDVVFIDHWKDDYLSDLMKLEELELLKPGARVVADNVGIFENTLEEYLSYVRSASHMQSTHHVTRMEYSDTIDDGVEVSVWLGPAATSAV